MEIQDDPKFRALNIYKSLQRERNMSAKKENRKPVDTVDISGKYNPEIKDADIRRDRIEEVRHKVNSGHYNDPEVIESIVDRLIQQFGA